MVLLCPSASWAPLPRVRSPWSEGTVSTWTLGPPPQDHTQTWPQVPFQGLCIFPGSILLLADLHAGGSSKGQLFTKGYRNNLTVSAKGSKHAYLASSRHEMEGREGGWRRVWANQGQHCLCHHISGPNSITLRNSKIQNSFFLDYYKRWSR